MVNSKSGGNHRAKREEILPFMTRLKAEACKADVQDFPEVRSGVPQTFCVNKYLNFQISSYLPGFIPIFCDVLSWPTKVFTVL